MTWLAVVLIGSLCVACFALGGQVGYIVHMAQNAVHREDENDA